MGRPAPIGVSPRPVLSALFGTGVPRYLIVVGALLVVVAANYGVSYLLRPWAHASRGRPPLVGYWMGDMVVERGDTRRVVLHLKENTVASRSRRFDMAGAAKVCGSKVAIHYDVHGNARSRDGAQFVLNFGQNRLRPGMHPNVLEGHWDGGDLLEFRTTFYTVDQDGRMSAYESASTSPARSDNSAGVVRFGLRRSTADRFDTAC